ncbi:hypothetical protein RRG08_004135 [Elysia crispata]|uniref:Uncharacterized protein n=1 Tax=Elysia crispata TaxID=231223 RepID=A0AAE0YW00_9GAST|nr:hypothetical protein RRG08_004135 [Elysia crispata]
MGTPQNGSTGLKLGVALPKHNRQTLPSLIHKLKGYPFLSCDIGFLIRSSAYFLPNLSCPSLCAQPPDASQLSSELVTRKTRKGSLVKASSPPSHTGFYAVYYGIKMLLKCWGAFKRSCINASSSIHNRFSNPAERF